MDDDAPTLVGRRGAETGSYFFPPTLAFSRNPSAPGEELEEVALSRRGRVWSWTTNHYKPPAPYVSPDPFVPYTVVAVELPEEQMVVLGPLAAGRRPGVAHGRRRGRAGAGDALRGRRPRVRRVELEAGMSASERSQVGEVAILGVGMHPWGKWGRNFVEYGVVAAQAALADAGVEWTRHPVRLRRRHDAQRLPGLRLRRDVRAGARLAGRAGGVVVRRVRERRDRAQHRAGADPRRALRRRARRRRRHDPEGLPRPERGRAGRRSRLAAVPPARRDQPDVLRALRPAPDGGCSARPRTTSPR